MQRRVVDTARCTDGPRWESLAGRAMLVPPPYHPVPGAPIYHLSLLTIMGLRRAQGADLLVLGSW
jgi:hypothetical protein